MTFVGAIATKDCIVVAADGRARGNGKVVNDAQKIELIDDHALVLLAGFIQDGLQDDLRNYIKSIAGRGLLTLDIARGLRSVVDTYNWQGEQLWLVLAGYDNDIPAIWMIDNVNNLMKLAAPFRTAGEHPDATMDHIDQQLGTWDYRVITHKQAAKALMTTLVQLEGIEPIKVGGITQVWHLTASGPTRLPQSQVDAIRHRLKVN